MLQKLKDSALMLRYQSILRWYMIVFISYSLTGWLGPFNLFLPIQQLVAAALAVGGGLLLLLDMLTNRSFLKVPHSRWLLAFIAVLAISIVLNAQYGWSGNLKTLYWQILQVGLFLPLAVILDDEQRRKGLRALFWIVFSLITLVNLISVAMFFAQYSTVFIDAMGKSQRLGFIDGRNFGLYIDPNYGGVVSICVMLATCWYLQNHQPSRVAKVLLIGSLVLNWYFAISTFSRIGPTCGIAAAVVWLALYLRNQRNGERSRASSLGVEAPAGDDPRNAESISQEAGRISQNAESISQNAESTKSGNSLKRAALISAILVLTMGGSYFTLSAATSSYAVWAHENDLFGSASRESTGGSQWYSGPIDHGPENISNNRFSIWRDYLTFSLDDPLFGKSPRNVMVQILEDHPDSYIAQREYGPHSGYVSIINATGWLGFATWLVLFGFFIRGLIGYLRRNAQVSVDFIFALTLLLVLLMKSGVNETLFFSYSFYASLFYIIVGGLLVLFERDRIRSLSKSPNA